MGLFSPLSQEESSTPISLSGSRSPHWPAPNTGYRTLAGRLGGARGLPGARAQGLLSFVGLRRWQKLDPAFAADGRYPLEVRRLDGRRRVARVVDRLGHGGEEAGMVACGRDQCQ